MSDWYPGGAEWDECSLESVHEHHGWGRRKFLGIRLSTAEVKRAIYEGDVEYFKDALLFRLKEAAIQANHFNWRCTSTRIDELGSSIVLLFEELPDSHREDVISHQINRLLEASGKENNG